MCNLDHHLRVWDTIGFVGRQHNNSRANHSHTYKKNQKINEAKKNKNKKQTWEMSIEYLMKEPGHITVGKKAQRNHRLEQKQQDGLQQLGKD